MPQNTPELAWWVMTGAMIGLLSLVTCGVGIIGYLIKTGNDDQKAGLGRLADKIDEMQAHSATTDITLAKHIAACMERHKEHTT